jgi:2-octaprenylphenol hydroxylase
MTQSNQQAAESAYYDIVIAGGGIVGLSLASELANTGFSVAIIDRNDPKPVSSEPECRVSAINLSALKRFKRAGVLNSPLAERVCTFEKMFVWDHAGAGQIGFDSAELGVPELGVIVENNVLQRMLLDSVSNADNISYLCPQEITGIDYNFDSGDHTLHLGALSDSDPVTEKRLTTKLLVGADGVNSAVRKAASIQRFSKAYRQQALVCNVRTSENHQHTAWQCFMPTGPLAFLPMYNGWSSIVWSLDDDAAEQRIALDDESFMLVLAEASDYRLGEILETGPRFLFPLTHGHVSEYVKPGMALIGDAAHNIHPLAGQGANLGIADAFVLADVIQDAKNAGRQWYALHTLKKYQRQRKGANLLMETSMTGFKELFGNKNTLISEVRNAGLSLVDHIPALKYKIIQQALGEQV